MGVEILVLKILLLKNVLKILPLKIFVLKKGNPNLVAERRGRTSEPNLGGRTLEPNDASGPNLGGRTSEPNLGGRTLEPNDASESNLGGRTSVLAEPQFWPNLGFAKSRTLGSNVGRPNVVAEGRFRPNVGLGPTSV